MSLCRAALWLVSRPVTLRQGTGTIVTAVVSLSYDVERSAVRAALIEAAESIGLHKPFVRIENLGDFAIEYKVGGLLTDVSRLLETHSNLRGAVIDSLHSSGIEIVSPVVEASRSLARDQLLIPSANTPVPDRSASAQDAVMFDQAAAAAASFEALETLRGEYDVFLKQRDATANPSERRRLAAEVDRLAKRLAALEE